MTQQINQPAQNRIPDFKNRQEMAEWFDTHDIADYQDEFKTIEARFELEQPRDENIVIRVQKPVKDRLDKIARSKGLNLSSLARMWIMEKLQTV
jgi:predicted DNA binding CopG/RHH family protein